MNDLRTAAQQALEALENTSPLGFNMESDKKFFAARTALRAALAQQDEPVARAPLKRGITGRCTRKVCECEKEGLGPECIYLEPVIDGYPLWSGIPKAEPVEPVEPVVRECSDPMCACRGGPCAECDEGEREKEIEDLRSSLYFYQRRCEALQSWQSKMRDPERTIVCDILANGKTLDPAVAGNRYTTPQQAEPVEPVAWIDALKDAFFEGFTSVATYNDTLLNSPEEAWENYKPPRAAPPQRKPLTEEEKRALADKLLSCQPESYEVSGVFDLISAVERAHGIKE